MLKRVKRILRLPLNQSILLLGARGTGKSTLIHHQFNSHNSLWLDLLDPQQEDRLARDPAELMAIVEASDKDYIIIDEIQKVPRLLDVVHRLIERTDKKFILTGSSARKLKRGGANLLAGRAFVYHLFPFSCIELGDAFQLEQVLQWGLLPKIYQLENEDEKRQFLQAYALTYLKEEIWSEQFIKKLDPFRKFLEVAAQSSGKIVNYANIARDVGVDDKTIKQYFTILEDTLIGFFLEPFQHSFRKRLSLKPKFYFFDVGVVRALARMLTLAVKPRTSMYGELFEHFVILECLKLASYFQSEYRFSYLKTKDDNEIDLVVERPGEPILFIEIKSSTDVHKADLVSFAQLVADFGDCEAVCFSNDRVSKKYDKITIIPWQVGLKHYFMKK